MRAQTQISVSWPTLLSAGSLLVVLGAGGLYVALLGVGALRPSPGTPATSAPVVTSAPAAPRERPAVDTSPALALPDVEVTLTKEGVERAGIVVGTCRRSHR